MKCKLYVVDSAATSAAATEKVYPSIHFKNPLKIVLTDFWFPNGFKIPVMVLVITFDD